MDEQQVLGYLDIARRDGFDGVLVINNDILGGARDVTLKVPKNKLRTVSLWQLSWWRILTEAVIQHEHRGVSDPDQAWILGELIDDILAEIDGPMLVHGLQGLAGAQLRLPRARRDHPNTEWLAERYEQFRAAG